MSPASARVNVGLKFKVKKEIIKCVHERMYLVLFGLLIVERYSRLPTNEIVFPNAL